MREYHNEDEASMRIAHSRRNQQQNDIDDNEFICCIAIRIQLFTSGVWSAAAAATATSNNQSLTDHLPNAICCVRFCLLPWYKSNRHNDGVRAMFCEFDQNVNYTAANSRRMNGAYTVHTHTHCALNSALSSFCCYINCKTNIEGAQLWLI